MLKCEFVAMHLLIFVMVCKSLKSRIPTIFLYADGFVYKSSTRTWVSLLQLLMTEIDSLLPTPSNDTLVSDLGHEDGGPADDISQQCAGHQHTGLAADGNSHAAESSVTLNTTQENEASNTNADSSSSNMKAPISLTVPSGKPNGLPTPIVKKASVYNVSLVNVFDSHY